VGHRRATGGQAGFTLIELLVSAAILALMISIAYGSFARASAAADRTEKFIGINHAARFIVARMADDLASASLPPNNAKAFFLGLPGASEEGGRMDKITFTGYGRRLIMPGSASDQAVISWYAVKTPGQKTYTLMRSENFNLFEDQTQDAEAAAAFDVTDKLVSLEIGYRRLASGDIPWNDTFDSKEIKTTPDLISVKFTLRGENGSEVTRSALFPVGEKL
jgi:general secretion pathway protein J